MEERGFPRTREPGAHGAARTSAMPAAQLSRVEAVRAEASPSLHVTLRARLTDHFLRRLEERGGDLGRLLVEDDFVVAEGWLRAVHDGDLNLVVPGFGQIRIRIDRFGGGGFVAVTFLPLGTT